MIQQLKRSSIPRTFTVTAANARECCGTNHNHIENEGITGKRYPFRRSSPIMIFSVSGEVSFAGQEKFIQWKDKMHQIVTKVVESSERRMRIK